MGRGSIYLTGRGNDPVLAILACLPRYITAYWSRLVKPTSYRSEPGRLVVPKRQAYHKTRLVGERGQ